MLLTTGGPSDFVFSNSDSYVFIEEVLWSGRTRLEGAKGMDSSELVRTTIGFPVDSVSHVCGRPPFCIGHGETQMCILGGAGLFGPLNSGPNNSCSSRLFDLMGGCRVDALVHPVHTGTKRMSMLNI